LYDGNRASLIALIACEIGPLDASSEKPSVPAGRHLGLKEGSQNSNANKVGFYPSADRLVLYAAAILREGMIREKAR